MRLVDGGGCNRSELGARAIDLVYCSVGVRVLELVTRYWVHTWSQNNYKVQKDKVVSTVQHCVLSER